MFYQFEVNGEIYKLRLTTMDIINLEKRIKCNPLAIFGAGDRVPTVTEMIEILAASMQQLQHGITINKAADIFDQWLADGNTVTDFISIIVEIFKVSGMIKEETEKN